MRPTAQTENLSVVVQPIQALDRLEDLLGDPQQAFEKLVTGALAPAGSGRSIETISVGQRPGARGAVYEFEYLLVRSTSRGEARLHTWSSVALGRQAPGAATRPLYTMTLVVPEATLTPERRETFVASWRSFELEV